MKEAYYDRIAQEYKDSKLLPFRRYIETYSLFQMAGDITGLNVLDLACGEGFYTRKLKQAGAEFVTGVDLSPEMINLALANEDENPIGCSYIINDVATLPCLDSYDLVVAMYLLNYAKSRNELLAFCRAAYRQLKPGGQFIGYNDNMMNHISLYGTYRKYGFIKQGNPKRHEGDPIRYTFFNLDGSKFQFNNYYLRTETYVEAFREAGFVNSQWIHPLLDPSQRDDRYWDHFMAYPPVIGFMAQK